MFFLIVGAVFVIGAAVVLYTGRSFVRERLSHVDPFSGSYGVAAPLPTATPVTTPEPTPEPTTTPKPAATPKPTPKTKPKPTPDPLALREKSYLIFPKAHAYFSKTAIDKKPYELTFRFEVEPKKTPCTFELSFDGKIILSKKLKASPAGTFQLRLMLKKPGKYTWQIQTEKSQSEKRDLVVKP
ncbi:MAG: hypothetical protein JST80_03560 [Bdellovibrionales bacterium]|nr:hypothetical protein [Bdellovibrionales bacterium]